MAEAEDAVFDKLMAMVGDRGPFQKRFNYLFNVGQIIFASMAYMNIILALSVPDHHCYVPGRETTNYSLEEWKSIVLPKDTDNRGMEVFSSCKMYNITGVDVQHLWQNTTKAEEVFNETISCTHGYIYDKQWYERTAVTQQDWVCDKDLYVTNTFVFNRVGECFGTFIFGQLGDTIGRRIIYYMSMMLTISGRLLSIVTSSSFLMFSIASILGSCAANTAFQSPLIIAMETSNVEARAHIAMMQCVGWTAGLCIMPMVFWWVRDWVWLIALTTLPYGIFALFPKYMIESPRWLANRRRYGDCAKQLNRIAKINGKDVEITEKLLVQMLPATSEETVYGLASLFSSWRLAKNACLLVISWSICCIVYLSIILNISRMGGNPFVNFLWQSFIELPASVIGQKMGDIIGRRYTNVVGFLLAALGCIPVIFMVKNTELDFYATAFTVFVKFAITINFFAVNLQSMETYPTCLRQTGISISAIIANSLGVLGPYIVYLGTNFDARYPFIIMGLMLIFGAAASLFLPETLYEKLPETLQEAQEFGANQPFWFYPRAPPKDSQPQSEEDGKVDDVTEKLNQPQFQP
ncbi:carcinine transporter-like [Lutzomyia longipalpis]|uniref:carcinine transporter-like n=1 Tax=Lutzomyia longipalpis TaxID=7200 RepID=UPI00248336A1|nr:carcinine transporter-like [Lutzomyia longipalpis]